MRIFEYQQYQKKTIDSQDLYQLGYYLDTVFEDCGLVFSFTEHFLKQLNNQRNGARPISITELKNLFVMMKRMHGWKLKNPDFGKEMVLKQKSTGLNVPFVIKQNAVKKQLEIVPLTIMRKKNFRTSDPVLQVENIMNEGFETALAMYKKAIKDEPNKDKRFIAANIADIFGFETRKFIKWIQDAKKKTPYLFEDEPKEKE